MCDLGITEMAMRRVYHFSVVKLCDSTYTVQCSIHTGSYLIHTVLCVQSTPRR